MKMKREQPPAMSAQALVAQSAVINNLICVGATR